MLRRRVLKSKEADRALWVTLFALIVVGVAVAMWLTARAEKKRLGRTGDLAPTEFVENPAVNAKPESSAASAPVTPAPVVVPPVQPETTASPVPKPPPGTKPPPATKPLPATKPPAAPSPAHAEARAADTVVALLTTPDSPTVGAMTAACKGTIQTKGPWSDAQTGRTWPECIDAAGNPMVVQFCTYARLASGEWVLSENNRRAPRCQAEFPLVRAGKLKNVSTR